MNRTSLSSDRGATNTAVCIAGMHRSGTSMVARMLNLCGLHLGTDADLMAASADNPKGYWEHETFVSLNRRLLRALGGEWDYPPQPPADWMADARLADVQAAAKVLIKGFSGRGLWGWKDPRTSLTFPFWQALLPQPKVVICVRNPLEVALSLRGRRPPAGTLPAVGWRLHAALQSALIGTLPWRARERIRLGMWRIAGEINGINGAQGSGRTTAFGLVREWRELVSFRLLLRRYKPLPYRTCLHLWWVYNQSLLNSAARHERIITHYNAYFSEPERELRRVLAFLGLPASDQVIAQSCDSISRGLRHHRFTAKDLRKYAPPVVVEQYEQMCAEAGYEDV